MCITNERRKDGWMITQQRRLPVDGKCSKARERLRTRLGEERRRGGRGLGGRRNGHNIVTYRRLTMTMTRIGLNWRLLSHISICKL